MAAAWATKAAPISVGAFAQALKGVPPIVRERVGNVASAHLAEKQGWPFLEEAIAWLCVFS